LEQDHSSNSRSTRNKLLKCLDTDLLVAILREKEEAKKHMTKLDMEGRQATTSVSAFELFYGAHKSRSIEENVRESRKLLSRLLVLPLATSSAERAGNIFATFEKKGDAIDFRDAMIAGIALENRLTVVTRNKSDFVRVPGLSIEEW
jgi:tRNA(fMet)-specific endonuclease VapC